MQNLSEKVKNLKNLPVEDKDKLIEWMSKSYEYAEERIQELSIFRQIEHYDEICGFKYYKLKGDHYYYFRENNFHRGFIFDENRKILPFTRYYLSHLERFVQFIDGVLSAVEAADLGSAFLINAPEVLSIQKWFKTYGHFQDEGFNLKSFLDLNSDYKDAIILLDYPTDDSQDGENFKWNKNYLKIDRYLFGASSINAFEIPQDLIRIANPTVIVNTFRSENFHRFSSSVSQKLISDVAKEKFKIFLSRSASYRDINNKKEVEQYYRSLGFSILNPECLEIELLISTMSRSTDVVLYWGSGATNLVYCKPYTNVTIIKSYSYSGENIEFWHKLFEEYKLKPTVIEADSNNDIILNNI